MFLVKIPNKKTGRVFLQISEGYRENGKVKQKKVKALGYLDELEKEHEDPIAHFKEVAKQMTEERAVAEIGRVLRLNPKAKLPKAEETSADLSIRKNIGYAALSILYHELEIDAFINNRRRYKKFKANLNSIFKMLIFNRILFPDSKRGAWENRGAFFEDTHYSLEDVYRSLDYFLQWRPALLTQLHQKLIKLYGRETLLLYYDVTNYYFEIDTADDLRKKGASKEHRPKPIVQMGLFMDEQGLPVTYDLFRGNANDCTTLPSMLDDTAVDLDVHHTIVISDKGIMSGDNVAKIRLQHNGYVISYAVRRAGKAFQAYVLDEEGYTDVYDSENRLVSRRKSRYAPREIEVTDANGKTKRTIINERQIVIYSEKYARRARAERQKSIDKASGQILSMSKNAKVSNRGSARYVKKVPFDKKTGEIKDNGDYLVILDEQRIDEDERLDGYYVICTNVVGLAEGEQPFGRRFRYTRDGFFQLNRSVSDNDIIEMYKGLWRIEETFKVTKSELKARPVFVSKEDHIRAHFLICFVSLLIMRLLEYRLDWNHSAAAIQKALAKAAGTHVSENLYVFDHYNEVLEAIGQEFGVDFSRQTLTKGEIRSMLAKTKRTS